MGKNVTVSVPDELVKQMESLSEVNWSQVARTCFRNYIMQRRNPDVSKLLEKLREQKGKEYVMGRRFAEKIVEQMGYVGLDILMKKYKEETQKEILKLPLPPFGRKLSQNEIMENLLKEKWLVTEHSSEFIKGTRERLLELHEALSGS